jgi:hypothetical protein
MVSIGTKFAVWNPTILAIATVAPIITAHHEDHDSEWARGFYRRHARAALNIVRNAGHASSF